MPGKFGNPDFRAVDLFDDVDIHDNLDQAEVIDINTEELDTEAKATAADLVENFRKIYYDDEFLNSQPTLKKRLEVELENLRMLIKMKKSDEITHDLLVRAIGQQSTNASLYKCLSTTQKSILDIQKQMDDTLKHLQDMLKNIQLEMNFKEEQEQKAKAEAEPGTEGDEEIANLTRGSKAFIEQLRGKATINIG